MERAGALINLGITCFFMYRIVRHMLRPGNNAGSTRMLMFACLATIPLTFFMLMAAGRQEVFREFGMPGSFAEYGFYNWLLFAGIILLYLLPLVLLGGLCFMLEMRNRFLLILFLVPFLSRLALSPAQDSMTAAIVQILVFLGSIVGGALLAAALDKWGPGTKAQEKNLRMILPGYGTAANMFFGVCVFALANQLIEFVHALIALLR
jgi:hypothetical protein